MDDKLKAAGEGALLLFLSAVMSNIGMVALISVAPLLLFAIRHGRKNASYLIAAGFLLNAALTLAAGGLPDDAVSSAFLAINLFIPLSLSAAGIVWLATGGRRLIGRLLVTLVPSVVLMVAMAAFFYTDRALLDAVFSAYEDAFAAMLGPVLGMIMPGIDIGIVAYIAVLMLLSLAFPVLLCGICASCFIFETALHSRESDWEERVARLEYSPDAVWGFIISWALVLLLRFVSAPLPLEIAVLNVAGVWTVIYAIEGFSVVFARIRRHSRAIRSMTVLIVILILGTLIPGINFIILIGLPLLGVLESFFNLKKTGGIDHEDHS